MRIEVGDADGCIPVLSSKMTGALTVDPSKGLIHLIGAGKTGHIGNGTEFKIL